MTSYLGCQSLVRDLIVREAATVLLQKGRQLVRHGEKAREVVLLGPAPRQVFRVNFGGGLRHHLGVFASSYGDMGKALLNAYNEVHISLAVRAPPRIVPEGISDLSKSHSERQRLSYLLRACVFFEDYKL